MEPFVRRGSHRGGAILVALIGFTLMVLPSTDAWADTIVVMMPEINAAESALVGISDELGEDFDIAVKRIDSSTTIDDIHQLIQDKKPVALVLMNNPTVRLYKKYQAAHADAQFPPAVILMTSFLAQTRKGLKNSTGIIYEIPGVTSFVNLRSLLHQSVRRIGVIYRPGFENFIADQAKLAEVEKFELIPIIVDPDNMRRSLTRALRKLLRGNQIDALWILNDNALLDKKLLQKGWLPALNKYRKPVVVGVGSLVSPNFSFGNFGVLPDHVALGVQAANIIFELADADWQLDSEELEFPLAVEKVLLVDFARKNFDLKEESLGQIDRLIE